MDAFISAFGIDWHLFVAHAANFLVLAGLLTWLLYKPVLKLVREREALIKKGVDDAEAAATQLAEADAAASARRVAAEAEAGGIVETARQSANDAKAGILKEAEERAAQIAADADARATEAAAKALRESEREIARLAMLAAAKAMGEKQ